MRIRFRLALTVCASLSLLCTSAGCYQQTVSAKGLGASRMSVQDSGRSNTALDRAFDSLFGSSDTTAARRWETPTETPRNALPAPRSVTAGKVAPKN